jgi:hypothetical protein
VLAVDDRLKPHHVADEMSKHVRVGPIIVVRFPRQEITGEAEIMILLEVKESVPTVSL